MTNGLALLAHWSVRQKTKQCQFSSVTSPCTGRQVYFMSCFQSLQSSEMTSVFDDDLCRPSPSNDVISSTQHHQQQQQHLVRRGGVRSNRKQKKKTTNCVSRLMSLVRRQFVCVVCSTGFMDRSSLTRHIRVHTGQRPYRCGICPAAFTQSGNLTRHVRAKHPQQQSQQPVR